jgi:hypothetical protein
MGQRKIENSAFILLIILKVQVEGADSFCFHFAPAHHVPIDVLIEPFHVLCKRYRVMGQAHHISYSTFSSSSSSEEGKGEKWNGGVGEEMGEETEQCVRE